MAIEALHHNLFCSEVEITFDGYSTSVNDTRCLYNKVSRNKVQKEKIDTMRNLNDEFEPIGETGQTA